MITVTDSGCHEHQACQLTLSGASARMVERFIANLPMNEGEFIYVCEHGHTHRVIPLAAKQNSGVNSLGYGKFTPEMFIDLMA